MDSVDVVLPRFLAGATGLGRLNADVNNCKTVGRLLVLAAADDEEAGSDAGATRVGCR